MKNSMGEEIQTYRETKKDGNRKVGYKPITGGKYRCTEGCAGKISKNGIDSHENSHRPNKPKITTQVNETKDKVSQVTNSGRGLSGNYSRPSYYSRHDED